MSDFRFGLDDYGLNYYPPEASDGDDGVDWGKVESVEIEWHSFVKVDEKSRWHELFGTPEKAARTMALMCECSPECSFCLLQGRAESICENGDYDALLEWLRSDANERR